ncbi:MAG: hypothetical protein ABEN55_03745 [Bradymonadaceae bacterium]
MTNSTRNLDSAAPKGDSMKLTDILAADTLNELQKQKGTSDQDNLDDVFERVMEESTPPTRRELVDLLADDLKMRDTFFDLQEGEPESLLKTAFQKTVYKMVDGWFRTWYEDGDQATFMAWLEDHRLAASFNRCTAITEIARERRERENL